MNRINPGPFVPSFSDPEKTQDAVASVSPEAFITPGPDIQTLNDGKQVDVSRGKALTGETGAIFSEVLKPNLIREERFKAADLTAIREVSAEDLESLTNPGSVESRMAAAKILYGEEFQTKAKALLGEVDITKEEDKFALAILTPHAQNDFINADNLLRTFYEQINSDLPTDQKITGSQFIEAVNKEGDDFDSAIDALNISGQHSNIMKSDRIKKFLGEMKRWANLSVDTPISTDPVAKALVETIKMARTEDLKPQDRVKMAGLIATLRTELPVKTTKEEADALLEAQVGVIRGQIGTGTPVVQRLDALKSISEKMVEQTATKSLKPALEAALLRKTKEPFADSPPAVQARVEAILSNDVTITREKVKQLIAVGLKLEPELRAQLMNDIRALALVEALDKYTKSVAVDDQGNELPAKSEALFALLSAKLLNNNEYSKRTLEAMFLGKDPLKAISFTAQDLDLAKSLMPASADTNILNGYLTDLPPAPANKESTMWRGLIGSLSEIRNFDLAAGLLDISQKPAGQQDAALKDYVEKVFKVTGPTPVPYYLRSIKENFLAPNLTPEQVAKGYVTLEQIYQAALAGTPTPHSGEFNYPNEIRLQFQSLWEVKEPNTLQAEEVNLTFANVVDGVLEQAKEDGLAGEIVLNGVKMTSEEAQYYLEKGFADLQPPDESLSFGAKLQRGWAWFKNGGWKTAGKIGAQIAIGAVAAYAGGFVAAGYLGYRVYSAGRSMYQNRANYKAILANKNNKWAAAGAAFGLLTQLGGEAIGFPGMALLTGVVEYVGAGIYQKRGYNKAQEVMIKGMADYQKQLDIRINAASGSDNEVYTAFLGKLKQELGITQDFADSAQLIAAVNEARKALRDSKSLEKLNRIGILVDNFMRAADAIDAGVANGTGTVPNPDTAANNDGEFAKLLKSNLEAKNIVTEYSEVIAMFVAGSTFGKSLGSLGRMGLQGAEFWKLGDGTLARETILGAAGVPEGLSGTSNSLTPDLSEAIVEGPNSELLTLIPKLESQLDARFGDVADIIGTRSVDIDGDGVKELFVLVNVEGSDVGAEVIIPVTSGGSLNFDQLAVHEAFPTNPAELALYAETSTFKNTFAIATGSNAANVTFTPAGGADGSGVLGFVNNGSGRFVAVTSDIGTEFVPASEYLEQFAQEVPVGNGSSTVTLTPELIQARDGSTWVGLNDPDGDLIAVLDHDGKPVSSFTNRSDITMSFPTQLTFTVDAENYDAPLPAGFDNAFTAESPAYTVNANDSLWVLGQRLAEQINKSNGPDDADISVNATAAAIMTEAQENGNYAALLKDLQNEGGVIGGRNQMTSLQPDDEVAWGKIAAMAPNAVAEAAEKANVAVPGLDGVVVGGSGSYEVDVPLNSLGVDVDTSLDATVTFLSEPIEPDFIYNEAETKLPDISQVEKDRIGFLERNFNGPFSDPVSFDAAERTDLVMSVEGFDEGNTSFTLWDSNASGKVTEIKASDIVDISYVNGTVAVRFNLDGEYVVESGTRLFASNGTENLEVARVQLEKATYTVTFADDTTTNSTGDVGGSSFQSQSASEFTGFTSGGDANAVGGGGATFDDPAAATAADDTSDAGDDAADSPESQEAQIRQLQQSIAATQQAARGTTGFYGTPEANPAIDPSAAAPSNFSNSTNDVTGNFDTTQATYRTLGQTLDENAGVIPRAFESNVRQVTDGLSLIRNDLQEGFFEAREVIADVTQLGAKTPFFDTSRGPDLTLPMVDTFEVETESGLATYDIGMVSKVTSDGLVIINPNNSTTLVPGIVNGIDIEAGTIYRGLEQLESNGGALRPQFTGDPVNSFRGGIRGALDTFNAPPAPTPPNQPTTIPGPIPQTPVTNLA